MFFSENPHLEAFICNGQYQQALKLINSIEKERSLSIDENLIKKYVLSFIYLDKGEFKNGKTVAEEIIKESKLKNLIIFHIGRNNISKFRNESIKNLTNLNFLFLNENPLDAKSWDQYKKRFRFP